MHFPVLGQAAAAALRANTFLGTRMHNEVDLKRAHTAHVTLYLTEWQSTAPVERALASLLPRLSSERCTLALTSPYAAGNFAMLRVTLTSCLQRSSDLVVNSTHTLAVQNQSVPAWVYGLPEPTRSEKIRYVQLYGSPNVFDQFQPHVTIGWAANASAVADAVQALAFEPVSFEARVLALGTTGAHGTVLKGRDLAQFNLTSSSGLDASAGGK